MWTIIFFTSWQCSSFVMGNDDWLSHLSDEIQLKCEKKPPPKSSNEKLIFILHLTSDDWPSDPSNKSRLKCYKRPLSHQKMKCLFLDYIQILMISQAIQAMKVNQNVTKKPPKSSKNEMLVFGLHSTSDDWLCNPSNKSWLKCGKRLPKSSKNEVLILYYVQLLMIGQAIRCSPPPQQKKVDFF